MRSDTVKLIIEIPTDFYEITKAKVAKNMTHALYATSIANGTPLNSNSEIAEVQAYFDGEAFGWDEGREDLAEVLKAEIEKLPNANPSYWHSGDMVEREEVLEILDNIGKGDEE